MLSDQSKDLFKRAIAMSGSALDPWTFPPITNYAERLAKQLGFNGTSESQMLEFFEKSSPFDFIIAKNNILEQEEKYGRFIDITVGPVVEPAWSKNPFFSKDPVIAARSAWSNDIDFIIGGTSYEGLFQAYKEYADNIDLYIETINSNPAYFAPLGSLKLNSSSPIAKAYGQKIKELYFGNSSQLTRNNLDQFYRVSSQKKVR
jgi:cholinesterase